MPLLPVTVIAIIFLLWTKSTLAPAPPDKPKETPEAELIKAVAKVLEKDAKR